MKNIALLIIVISLLGLPLFFSGDVSAAGNITITKPEISRIDFGNLKLGERIVLKGGYEAAYLGKDWKTGEYTFRANLDAPMYLDDLTTKIQCTWYDNKGIWYSGANMFSAVVVGERVTFRP